MVERVAIASLTTDEPSAASGEQDIVCKEGKLEVFNTDWDTMDVWILSNVGCQMLNTKLMEKRGHGEPLPCSIRDGKSRGGGELSSN